MITKAIPSAEFLQSLLRYEGETGNLYWLSRGKDFAISNGWTLNVLAVWNARYAGHVAGRTNSYGYQVVKILDDVFMAHRLVWMMEMGSPTGFIDHIDGNRRNNRLENLRCVSRSDNQRNRRLNCNSTTGVVGVSYCAKSGMWHAKISIQGKLIRLGSHNHKEAAIAARKQAEREFGFHENHGRPS